MTTEDLAHMLLSASRAARAGSCVDLAGRAPGGKNRLRFEVDGSSGSLAWDARAPEELWLGHRDRPNETLLARSGADATGRCERTTPARRATPRASPTRSSELYRAVYRAVAAGEPDEPDYPTFADGHARTCSATAIAASARERTRGSEVPA